MQFQRTLRRRQRAAPASVDELYVIGIDGGEGSGGMRVLGRRDPRFPWRQKRLRRTLGSVLPLGKLRGRGGDISVALMHAFPRL